MLDVNAGIPLADEPKILAECIKLVQDTVPVPLSIDSSIVEALEAGLAVYKGKPLVNSVTGEEERLERVLPLVKKYNCRRRRHLQRRDRHLRGSRTCASRSPRRSSSAPPISASRARTSWSTRWSCRSAPSTMPGRKLMHLLRRLQGELKVNTTCGASNFSFGLPNRRGLNASFLPMMIGAGMTSAIMNPLHLEDIQAILGADVVMGHDPNCARLDQEVPRAAGRGRAGRRRPPRAPPGAGMRRSATR